MELPVRKAGLWEMKMLRTGSPTPDMTMQHCTDETTDKEMSTVVLAGRRRRIVLEAGYPEDRDRLCHRFRLRHRAACRSRRMRKSPAISIPPTPSSPRRTARAARPACRATRTTTIEAKWLGACKADQKPGDIMMPGGMKMNIKDMEKLKGLMPEASGEVVRSGPFLHLAPLAGRGRIASQM